MEKKISINERFNSANSLRAVLIRDFATKKKCFFFFIAHEKIYGLVFQSHEIACFPFREFYFFFGSSQAKNDFKSNHLR